MPQISKVVECKYCNATVFENNEFWRTPVGQVRALRALKAHQATCEKAPKAPVYSGTAQIAEKPCPICLKVMRADHIVRHIASKHPLEAICATSLKHRAEALEKRLPIVVCCNSEGDGVFRACLECGKGCLATCASKIIYPTLSLHMNIRDENHSKCSAKFDERYKELFELQEIEPIGENKGGDWANQTPVNGAGVSAENVDQVKGIIDTWKTVSGWEEDDEPVSLEDVRHWIASDDRRHERARNLLQRRDARIKELEAELEALKAPKEAPTNTVVFKPEISEAAAPAEDLTAAYQALNEDYEALKSAAIEREAELLSEVEDLEGRLLETQGAPKLPAELTTAVKLTYNWDPDAEPEEPAMEEMMASLVSEVRTHRSTIIKLRRQIARIMGE